MSEAALGCLYAGATVGAWYPITPSSSLAEAFASHCRRYRVDPDTGKARYAWVTFVPLTFVATTTLTAGVLSVRDNFWPMAVGPNPARHFQGYLNTTLTVIMMVCVVVILANAIWKWLQVLRGRIAVAPATS